MLTPEGEVFRAGNPGASAGPRVFSLRVGTVSEVRSLLHTIPTVALLCQNTMSRLGPDGVFYETCCTFDLFARVLDWRGCWGKPGSSGVPSETVRSGGARPRCLGAERQFVRLCGRWITCTIRVLLHM